MRFLTSWKMLNLASICSSCGDPVERMRRRFAHLVESRGALKIIATFFNRWLAVPAYRRQQVAKTQQAGRSCRRQQVPNPFSSLTSALSVEHRCERFGKDAGKTYDATESTSAGDSLDGAEHLEVAKADSEIDIAPQHYSTHDVADAELPSFWSHGHPHCCQAPCKFYRRQRGCKQGKECTRCRLCFLTRESERQKSAASQSRTNLIWINQCVTCALYLRES